eukprot:TRINITY_DN14748_c0_g1_i1.p1 TRINITY_DN14748_c0_g1~~TRINITY_DN14748_c0_g1_i1.p1  ORF type:complete len:1355 (-),score=290.79 TRINITY_DN14748_c0_g1_i1:59-4123(-)
MASSEQDGKGSGRNPLRAPSRGSLTLEVPPQRQTRPHAHIEAMQSAVSAAAVTGSPRISTTSSQKTACTNPGQVQVAPARQWSPAGSPSGITNSEGEEAMGSGPAPMSPQLSCASSPLGSVAGGPSGASPLADEMELGVSFSKRTSKASRTSKSPGASQPASSQDDKRKSVSTSQSSQGDSCSYGRHSTYRSSEAHAQGAHDDTGAGSSRARGSRFSNRSSATVTTIVLENGGVVHAGEEASDDDDGGKEKKGAKRSEKFKSDEKRRRSSFIDSGRLERATNLRREFSLIENDGQHKVAQILNYCRGCLCCFTMYRFFLQKDFIQTPVANTVCGAVIIANSLLIGVEMEFNNGSENEQVSWFAVESSFLVFFIAELGLRVRAVGARKFMFDYALQLDLALVAFGIMDTWLLTALMLNTRNTDAMFKVTLLRLVRLARIIRVLRVIRLFRYFHELVLLARGILGALQALSWSLMLIFMILYVGAVLTTTWYNMTYLSATETLSPEQLTDYKDWFGSVGNSLLTLFQLMTLEGWPTVVWGSMEVWNFSWLFFVPFIMITNVSLLNAVTAVVVEKVFSIAQNESSEEVKRAEKQRLRALKSLKALFMSIDVDHNGTLDIQEFKEVISNTEIASGLAELGIARYEAGELFECLDVDGDNTLTIAEFVEGLLRCSGNAQSKHLLQVQYDLLRSYNSTKSQINDLHEIIRSVLKTASRAAGVNLKKKNRPLKSGVSRSGDRITCHERLSPKEPKQPADRLPSNDSPPPRQHGQQPEKRGIIGESPRVSSLSPGCSRQNSGNTLGQDSDKAADPSKPDVAVAGHEAPTAVTQQRAAEGGELVSEALGSITSVPENEVGQVPPEPEMEADPEEEPAQGDEAAMDSEASQSASSSDPYRGPSVQPRPKAKGQAQPAPTPAPIPEEDSSVIGTPPQRPAPAAHESEAPHRPLPPPGVPGDATPAPPSASPPDFLAAAQGGPVAASEEEASRRTGHPAPSPALGIQAAATAASHSPPRSLTPPALSRRASRCNSNSSPSTSKGWLDAAQGEQRLLAQVIRAQLAEMKDMQKCFCTFREEVLSGADAKDATRDRRTALKQEETSPSPLQLMAMAALGNEGTNPSKTAHRTGRRHAGAEIRAETSVPKRASEAVVSRMSLLPEDPDAEADEQKKARGSRKSRRLSSMAKGSRASRRASGVLSAPAGESVETNTETPKRRASHAPKPRPVAEVPRGFGSRGVSQAIPRRPSIGGASPTRQRSVAQGLIAGLEAARSPSPDRTDGKRRNSGSQGGNEAATQPKRRASFSGILGQLPGGTAPMPPPALGLVAIASAASSQQAPAPKAAPRRNSFSGIMSSFRTPNAPPGL